MIDKSECLKKYFGYSSFREGQEKVIDAILSGNDAMAIMPTGAGKSICYQVPALCMDGVTIVVSPLISLMSDQVKFLNSVGIYAAYINSSLSERAINKVFDMAETGKYKIIYVAPERLLTDRFLRLSQKLTIDLLAIDEAHCVSQWGQNFRPSYLDISKYISSLDRRPVIATFTATATDRVKEDIEFIIGLNNPDVTITGYNRTNLFFSVKRSVDKMSDTLEYLENHSGESGIIYCNTRANVDDVWEMLTKKGFDVTRYHAGLSAEEREKNQNDFVYDEKPIMVATNAFGMGIDKSNVRFLLHYNMSKDLESYYQEAGRAGRDGLESDCTLLYAPKDVRTGEFLVKKSFEQSELDIESARIVFENDLERLKKMAFYSTTTDCLRSYILNYFGEKTNVYCGKCSNCLTEFEERDVTEIARGIIRAVYMLGQKYGASIITDFLRGSKNQKIMKFGLDQVQFYGDLHGVNTNMIRQIINELIMLEYLTQTNSEYPVLRLGERYNELTNDSKIIIKLPKNIEVERKPSKPSKTNKLSKNYHDVDNNLFEELRTLRRQLAREQNVPPYIIFTDRALVEMAAYKPVNKEQMLKINGVGEVKYEKYGEMFMDVVGKYIDDKEKVTGLSQIDAKKFKANVTKTNTNTYAWWTNQYPDHVVIKKEGAFWTCRGESAETVSELLGYRLGGSEANPMTGSPNLEPITDGLCDNRVSYIVVEDGNIIEEKNY